MSKLDPVAYVPPVGLPGRQIKLSKRDEAAEPRSIAATILDEPQATRSGQSSKALPIRPVIRSPGALGIKLDTSVGNTNGKSPRQLYPKRESSRAFKKKPLGRKGTIPTPLDLSQDLSPFDRFLPFCLSPSTAGRSRNGKLAPSRVAAKTAPKQSAATTPTIVITPAMEFEMPPKISDSLDRDRRVPVASSIYSRSSPLCNDVPPVPNISSCSVDPTLAQYHSIPSFQGAEDDDSSIHQPISCTSLTEAGERTSIETVLPTPRRSVGWWNLLVSPVSATFAAKGWISPVSDEESMSDPILPHAAKIAGTSDEHDDTPRRNSMSSRPHSWSKVEASGLIGAANPYYDPTEEFHTPIMESFAPIAAAPARSVAQNSAIQTNKSIPEEPVRDSLGITSFGLRGSEPGSGLLRPSMRQMEDTPATKARPVSIPAVVEVASVGRIQTAKAIDTTPALNRPPFEIRTWPFRDVAIVAEQYTPRCDTESSKSVPSVGQHSWPFRDEDKIIRGNSASASDIGSGVKRTVTFGDQDEIIEDTDSEQEKIVRVPTASDYQPGKSAMKVQSQRYDSLERQPLTADNLLPERRKKRKWIWISIFGGLLAIVILSMILAMTITKSYSDMPVQEQWLNLTGFPPLPTGIATIAGPKMAWERSGCVKPQEMWSCSVPKEEQAAIQPNAPNQPNFRLEIRFENGTISNNSLVEPSVKRSVYGGISHTALAMALSKSLSKRDALSPLLYTASPPPPSLEDQTFLGNTTDNIVSPYDGEETPFFISLLPPPTTPDPETSHSAAKRSPPPVPSDMGLSATPSATLVPLSLAQPLRLYNRGLSTEHYGFYTYFTRAIFLRLASTSNATSTSASPTAAPTLAGAPSLNANGGAPAASANALCTWPQTRFRVQLWTRAGFVGTVPAGSPPSSSSAAPTPTSAAAAAATNPGTASAFDLAFPGSFPYPATLSLDRHGGDPAAKGVVCYAYDAATGALLTDAYRVVSEDRAFGGTDVDAAAGAFEAGQANSAAGGVDGGTGGCGCEWRNWG